MKVKEFTAIGKQLLPQLPGFVADKHRVFKVPVDDVFRGLSFERCSDPNYFHISVLFLPLYVPQESVHLSHGRRIGNALNWRADNPNLVADLNEAIRKEAISFLNKVSTLHGVIERLRTDIDVDRQRANPHVLEALAYTLLKTGDYPSALQVLVELKRKLDGYEPKSPWMLEQRTRAELIDQKIRMDSEAALAQLENWKNNTIQNLGFEKYR